MERDFNYKEETQYARRSRLILLALFGAAFFIGVAAFVLITPTIFPDRSSTNADSSMLVETVPASLVNITSVVTRQATISQPAEARLQAQNLGWLRKVEVHRGQMVKTGQTVAVIEPLDGLAMQAVDRFRTALQTLALLQTQLADTRYALIDAEAAAADAEDALAQTSINLSDKQETLKLANARAEQALQSLQSEQDRLRQSQELNRLGAISSSQVEAFKSAELQAQRQVNQSREAAIKAEKQAAEAMQQLRSGQTNLNRFNVLLVEARRQENAARKQVGKQQVVVEQMHRAMKAARANKKPVMVTSPADGIVLNISSEPGALVTPEMTIARIRKLDVVIAVVRSADVENGMVKPGMSAALILPHTNKALEGKVVEVMPFPGPAKIRKVCLEVTDTRKVLKPGQKATAQITVSRTKAVSVPLKSIVKTRKGPAVWIVTGGEAHVQPVKLMRSSGKNAIVTNGLRDGDSIIISTNKPLREGAPVVIKI